MREDHDLEILFVDNHLLAVAKPPGLVTQPSGHHRDSLEIRAKRWLQKRFQKPGNVFLEAVHRIDRLASGVVLFARTSKALSRLNASVRERKVAKVYLALVEGRMSPPSDRLVHWLRHGDHRAEVAERGARAARESVLEYRCVAEVGDRTLLEVQLLTGRYHQIRVQLSEVGYPVAGDQLYGGGKTSGGLGIALHHWRLTVPHPTLGETVEMVAPLPDTAPWDGVSRQTGIKSGAFDDVTSSSPKFEITNPKSKM
ncbi:MAG: RluA family pseudouridine synthase [Lentisphaeria bacterium]|nr:RluA family pseudouridine synthase [Lentisphaeria bacterium]